MTIRCSSEKYMGGDLANRQGMRGLELPDGPGAFQGGSFISILALPCTAVNLHVAHESRSPKSCNLTN